MMPSKTRRALATTAAGSLGALSRRWASYDSASLTSRNLAGKVDAGLGPSSDDNLPRLNQDRHTVETAIGHLPMSPLFDPAWMKSRRRQRKADPSKPVGRFRKKLAKNPFARALESPIRRCQYTTVLLPRYFLQDFELVTHPKTGTAWWAPGPLSFGKLAPEGSEAAANTDDDVNTPVSEAELPDQNLPAAMRPAGSPPEAPAPSARPRGPLTSYTLGRKSVVDSLGGKNKRYTSVLLAVRTGMAVAPNMRNPIWREDMGDVLLRMMRRLATDALVTCAIPAKASKGAMESLRPFSNWAEVDRTKPGGCVLWLPDDSCHPMRAAPFATLDVTDARYNQKMVIYNMPWLLGNLEFERLKRESHTFRGHQIVVLRHGRSNAVMQLHLLLWRLQGYLAQPQDVE
ncbi:hypothetical protein JDV02_004205 [Purpureocillium takamizusanense]|uniref:Esterase-like protein n=1 Tax=Purpureocillium takamizusanense TaxID=2060973 RepID=A0A9Q8QFE1_9HYPO|nr:uncharacterized protein JDV02_004205 [Purpureocillium takamizusanense]UNI17896.1 hypothetical protein JDV02_004205 [Purpureocillium takamizusanense]